MIRWLTLLNSRMRFKKPELTFDSKLSAKELMARLRGAVRTSPTVTGTLQGSNFVLSGRSQLAGGYRRHFYGQVVDTGAKTVIEGSFQLLPAIRVLLIIIASLVLLAGLATSIQQDSVTPGLITLLLLLGGVQVLRHQVSRSASGEEAVLKLLVDVSKGS